MAKQKFYAVKNGRNTGIFLTWDDCKKQVMGYPGAIYKSFGTQEEAYTYLGVSSDKNDNKSSSSDDEKIKPVEIYVDGSYHAGTGEFSYGMVVLRDGTEECFSQKMNDKELAKMHNVAGEIKGAEAAMQYAMDNKIPSILIYHDYQGIASWCTGEWKTNKPGTIAYRDFYLNASRNIDISFCKVKGHSNDKYNDMVDRLAKDALGII